MRHELRPLFDRVVIKELDPDRVRRIFVPLYADLLREEARHANGKDGLEASYRQLVDVLEAKNVTYDELIFSLA